MIPWKRRLLVALLSPFGPQKAVSRSVSLGYWLFANRVLARKACGRLFRIPHRPNHELIEIDITYECNLRCFNCNRSCRQAPAEERMTLDQMRRFLDQSIRAKRRWQQIRVLGGEPTLHPDLTEMLGLLLGYRAAHSPATRIVVVTNGVGSRVKEVLGRLPQGVLIENSGKESVRQEFDCFNLAPADAPHSRKLDFSLGCPYTSLCGIGLNRFGYYPCGVAGGIDRVMGFDRGRKDLPPKNDPMRAELSLLCRYCGHFQLFGDTMQKEEMSPSWVKAYARFMKARPALTLFGSETCRTAAEGGENPGPHTEEPADDLCNG